MLECLSARSETNTVPNVPGRVCRLPYPSWFSLHTTTLTVKPRWQHMIQIRGSNGPLKEKMKIFDGTEELSFICSLRWAGDLLYIGACIESYIGIKFIIF
jgi:hypothetical protein